MVKIERKRDKLVNAIIQLSHDYNTDGVIEKYDKYEWDRLTLLSFVDNIYNGSPSALSNDEIITLIEKCLHYYSDNGEYQRQRLRNNLNKALGIPDENCNNFKVSLPDTSLQDVVAAPPDFLWHPYLLRNELNVMFGSGGVGKGFVCTLIVKHILQGIEFPNGEQCEQGGVMLFSAEEGKDFLKHKYMRAGIPEDIINTQLKIIDQNAISEYFKQDGTSGLYPLEAQIKHDFPDGNCKFLVIDPIENYLRDVNLNSRSEVSIALADLSAMGRKLGITILYVCHENKREGKGGGSVNNKVSGSGSFIDVPRSAISVMCEYGEDGNEIHYIVSTKHNTSTEGDALQYVITDEKTYWNGTINRSRALLDEARRLGMNPDVLLKSKRNQDMSNNSLVRAICDRAYKEYSKENKCVTFKLTYKDLEYAYPDVQDLWQGMKYPAKALSNVSDYVASLGVIIQASVTFTHNGKSCKGFSIAIKDADTLTKYINNDIGIH